MIKIETIRSSMLKSVSYDETESSLIVEFHNGGEYKYKAVPKEIFDAMLNSDSEGKYFLANIKNKFECEKL